MVKKIRIENFQGIDNNKEISFEANSKRKADKFGIAKTNGKEILLSVALLGKNASGKTSFIRGIDTIALIASGYFYKNILRRLEFIYGREKSEIDDINNENLNIKSKNIINFIRKEWFNDPMKSMKFFVEFIDSKNVIKLNIELTTKGIVKEIIHKNNEIFKKQTTSLENFKSNIHNKELIFNKIVFKQLTSLDFEIIYFWEDKLDFKKQKKITKTMFLKWLRLADDKIKKIIWTSKGGIEGFIIDNENSEKKISPSELSSGTRKWLHFGYVFCKALLAKQTFLFIDEIEKSLHPSLAKFLITIISDRKINKQKSQLFFTSHSPFIVDIPFRKDAINFIDATNKIVNMGQIKIREDINVSKNYINGKLSSHPTKSDMFEFIEEFHA